MVSSIILEKLEALPESLQTEFLHYIEFLAARYTVAEKITLDFPKKRGGLGALKGKIWIADDFDEPLEDWQEYM